MRAGVCNIVFLCALLVLGFSAPARADSGLCNRFMAALAHALGNTTEEFKRRIAFLLETGKIGDEHLARMLASDVPASPFASDRHLSSDLLPHAQAIARLLGEGAIDWKEARGFVEEVSRKLARSGIERVIDEKKTETVLYPHLIKIITMSRDGALKIVVFKKGGVAYVAVTGSTNERVDVFEALTGRVVGKIDMAGMSIFSLSAFEKDGVEYLAMSGGVSLSTLGTSTVWIVEAFTGKVVRTIRIRDAVNLAPESFRKAGEPYLAMCSTRGHTLMMEALTGEHMNATEVRVAVDAVPGSFERDGLPYLAIGAHTDLLYVVDASTGHWVKKLKMDGSVASSPVVFEKAGAFFIVAEVEKRDAFGKVVSQIDVIDEKTERVVRTITPEAAARSSLAVFVKEGVPYIVRTSFDGRIELFEALTGRAISNLSFGHDIDLAHALFESDGVVYLASGGKGGNVSIVQLYGPLSKEKR